MNEWYEMKLLTYNQLRCAASDVTLGYPLEIIEVEDMQVFESEANFAFIKGILPTLNWRGVKIAAAAVGLNQGLVPDTLSTYNLEDKEFLLAMHKLLLDIDIIKGILKCPESGRIFAIENGIPNMK